MKNGWMDIHHHLLYGLDDGPRDPGAMRALLERAAAEGISEIIATPHVTPGVVPFDDGRYQAALAEADAHARRLAAPIAVHPGAEILYTDQTPRFLRSGAIPTLAHTDRVLVEFSPDVRYDRLRAALDQIRCSGFLPVLAHVERYRCLTLRPGRAMRLREEAGVFYQMNSRTVLRATGLAQRLFVAGMLKAGAIDAIATDAHNASSRPPEMRRALESIARKYGAEYARRLADGSLLRDETARPGEEPGAE